MRVKEHNESPTSVAQIMRKVQAQPQLGNMAMLHIPHARQKGSPPFFSTARHNLQEVLQFACKGRANTHFLIIRDVYEFLSTCHTRSSITRKRQKARRALVSVLGGTSAAVMTAASVTACKCKRSLSVNPQQHMCTQDG